MDAFARLPAAERREIIQEVATRMSVDYTIIEKDFWVCWSLRSLFSLSTGHAPKIFKGGTSLSKAYGLIKRFSEDIDVVTAVTFFLAGGLADPADTDISKQQRHKRMAALDVECAKYIGVTLAGELQRQFANRLGGEGGWRLTIDPDDPYGHTLLFQFPPSASDIEHTYIRGSVKIELGWRSATSPADRRTVTPYIADVIHDLMAAEVPCTTLVPDRTFWEKVTALHATSFRDDLPSFYSRHYSDVATMLGTSVGVAASRDLIMLDEVRRYKDLFYSSARARYDLAVPGSLVVVPRAEMIRELASDYREMESMFFEKPLPFDQVIERLRLFEAEVNC